MRKTLIISGLLALLCLNQNCEAQINLDEAQSNIRVDLGEGNQILLQEKELRFAVKKDIEQINNLNKTITDINATLKKMPNTLDPYLAYKITYTIPGEGASNLKVKRIQEEKFYQTEGAKQGQPLKQIADSIIIQYPSFNLILTVKNLKELDKLEKRPLDGYIEALKRDFESFPNKYHRNFIEMKYKAEGNNLERTHSRLIRRDYIELSPSAGLSVIRDKIVPTVGANAIIVFKEQFYFGPAIETQFLFERNEEGNYKVFHNTFFGGEIGFKLKENAFTPPGWLSIGFDKLINREGNFYDADTYRLSLNVPVINSRIKLSPQWYLSSKGDGFLGFKIGLGL